MPLAWRTSVPRDALSLARKWRDESVRWLRGGVRRGTDSVAPGTYKGGLYVRSHARTYVDGLKVYFLNELCQQ